MGSLNCEGVWIFGNRTPPLLDGNRYRERQSEGTPYPSWIDEWDNPDDDVYDEEEDID